MKTIILLGAAVIAGIVRYPVEGPQTLADDEADRLIEVGQAEEAEDDIEPEIDEAGEDLEAMTLPDLGILVTKEGVPLNGATKKADIIAAIRAHRAAAE
jgi:hypothetical protein